MSDFAEFIETLGETPSPPAKDSRTDFRLNFEAALAADNALIDEMNDIADIDSEPTAYQRDMHWLVACVSELEGDELDIVGLVIERLRHGRGIYGQWVASADLRDHDAETQDELVDAAIYTAMREIRKRRLAG